MSELGPTRTYSDLTATERLRALLDERGVEWWAEDDPEDPPYYLVTKWFSNASEQTFEEIPAIRSRSLKAFCVTPEQAVAATLGRGTCQVDVLNTGDCAGYECSEYIMHCNACGHEFGHVLYNEDGDVWMSEPPNYCPNCGRRCVG